MVIGNSSSAMLSSSPKRALINGVTEEVCQVSKTADSGINSVLFRFDEAGNCYLTIVTTGAVHNIPFGLDSWAYGMTDRTLSMSGGVYPNKMGVTPVNTAGICSWTAAETLSAHYISMFNPGSAETFRFTFSKDQLNMEIVAPSARRLGPPGMSQPKPENIVLLGTKTDE